MGNINNKGHSMKNSAENMAYRKKANNRRRRRQKRRIAAVMLCFSIFAAVCIVLIVKLTQKFIAYGERMNSEGYEEDIDKSVSEDTLANAAITEHVISFEGISQEDIPTGCEAVSTVAVLKYYGVNITAEGFIDEFLPKMDFYKKNGKVYGADPTEKFAGNPYENGSLGCYCEVIEEALRSMQESNYKGTENLSVKAKRGLSLSELAVTYVTDDKPVIIWATIDMQESSDGFTYYLENGEEYVWRACEHCVVLCGYDDDNYYIMDPLKEGKIVKYSKSLVEQRYKEMGEQAVIIYN